MPETKNLSVDTYSLEYIADEAAGLRHARPPLPTAAGPAPNHEFNDLQFPNFLKQMENEPAGEGDPVEDLVKRFKAWQIYSKAERDPTKLKALVLKMYPLKKEEHVPAVATTSTYVPRSPYCAYCKKDGHWVRDCSDKPATFKCFHCNEDGHLARNCPKVKAPPAPEKKTVTFKEDKDKGKEGLSKASQGQEDEETRT